jgi:two-component system, chemotaxis family, protein-glutamate methylesterase/glutaminase
VGDDRIVVIGASLGGLQAIFEVLRAIPADFPCPIAFVQHRAVSESDALARLLRSRTALQVREPFDKEIIQPGYFYLAPADYHLIVEQREFALSTGPDVNYARPSIDVLFESAADSYREGTIGVILTGANQDGAAGAAKIKALGGRLIVQDPLTSECSVMPRSAIQATMPDAILVLPEIGKCLTDWCANRSEQKCASSVEEADGKRYDLLNG